MLRVPSPLVGDLLLEGRDLWETRVSTDDDGSGSLGRLPRAGQSAYLLFGLDLDGELLLLQVLNRRRPCQLLVGCPGPASTRVGSER